MELLLLKNKIIDTNVLLIYHQILYLLMFFVARKKTYHGTHFLMDCFLNADS